GHHVPSEIVDLILDYYSNFMIRVTIGSGLWLKSRVWDPQQCYSSGNPLSTSYVEEMYYAWLEDHKNVHESWDAYFRSAQANNPTEEAGERHLSALLQGRAMSQTPAMSQKVVQDHLAVYNLIRAYQV
ncbi:2-oxoglutarate dehydrogenase-like, mitochondrial, partial [Silurus asotus]